MKSDQAGRIAARFVAPEDFGFMHDIVVQQGNRLLTQTAFNLDMTARIVGASSGPIGTPIEVEVQGIGWRELEGSWVLLYDNKYTGFMSAVTTSGTARFNVPATGHIGLHILEILHTDFGSPYRNTQQSPVPDRPQFKLEFTVTPGAPVLPPPPVAQAQTQVRSLPPQGELVATPASSGIDQPVRSTGAGFKPGKAYTLNWNTVVGNRMTGRGWRRSRVRSPKPRRTPPAAPNSASRCRTISAASTTSGSTSAAGRRRTAPIGSSRPRCRSMWHAGRPGTTLRIHIKGVGWSETANIYTVVYDNATSGYACAFNSQGDIEIIMQATGEPGWHFIDLYPAIYKGKETRPNNYRLPQLTFADDHPGEDLPRFRFAFEVTRRARSGRRP